MSKIKEFLIYFTANTDDLKKGAKEAESATDKIEKKLKETKATSDTLGESLLKNATAFTKLAASGYAFSLISSGVRNMIAQGQELARTSQYIGVGIDDLQAWSKAVQLAGGNAEDFQRSLSSVSQHFQIPESAAIKLFPKIADNLSKLSQFGARRYGEFLGLTPSTIMLLQQGRREVDAMVKKQKEFATFTREDAIQLLSLNKAINSTKVSLDNIYTSLAKDTIPIFAVFLNAIDKVVQYLSEHYEVLEGGGLAAGLLGIAAAIRAIVVAVSALSAPLRVAIAGITALSLAYEDVKKTMEGSKNTITSKLIELREKYIPDSLKEQRTRNMNLFYRDEDFRKVGTNNKSLPLVSPAMVNNKNQTVNIGDVIINTQSDNPAAIGDHFMNFLNGQLQQANAYFDSGVT